MRCAVIAGQLGADLARRIVQAQLIAARATDFAAAQARQITVARQAAARAQAGRHGHGVIQLANDDGPVRVAAEKVDQHFAADARQAHRAALPADAGAIAGPARRHPHPGRIALGIRRARTVGMCVVLRARGNKAHLDPAQRVAMHLFIGGPHHQRALQAHHGQVAARIESGHDGNAAPHATETVAVAQGHALARRRQARHRPTNGFARTGGRCAHRGPSANCCWPVRSGR